MSLIWWILGVGAVVGFFYYSNLLTRKWSEYPEKIFTKKIFQTALIVRIAWVVISYFLYLIMTGEPFEFSPGDSLFYDEMGRYGAGLMAHGQFPAFTLHVKNMPADWLFPIMGYPLYLSVIYFLTGNSILIVRLVKAVLSTLTCVFVYRLAKRNFGEETGRIAAVLCMLMPNFIYYTGIHLKETEMVVFGACVFGTYGLCHAQFKINY